MKRKPKTVKYDVWKPTQEELLEEALATEEINLKSLGTERQSLTI